MNPTSLPELSKPSGALDLSKETMISNHVMRGNKKGNIMSQPLSIPLKGPIKMGNLFLATGKAAGHFFGKFKWKLLYKNSDLKGGVQGEPLPPRPLHAGR